MNQSVFFDHDLMVHMSLISIIIMLLLYGVVWVHRWQSTILFCRSRMNTFIQILVLFLMWTMTLICKLYIFVSTVWSAILFMIWLTILSMPGLTILFIIPMNSLFHIHHIVIINIPLPSLLFPDCLRHVTSTWRWPFIFHHLIRNATHLLFINKFILIL